MFNQREMARADIGDDPAVATSIAHLRQVRRFQQRVGHTFQRRDHQQQPSPVFALVQHNAEYLSQPGCHADG
jgi:hypothetical protein